ncbi:hypothetical protein ACF0H5_010507 [Mactra antiquata]
MESKPLSPILEFLEYVKNHNEAKAKDKIDSVETEIREIKKEKKYRNGELKEHVKMLEEMIKNIQKKKFKDARKDHVKVKNGLKKHIESRMSEIQDVQQLSVEGGRMSPTKRAQSRKSKQKEGKTKRSEASSDFIDEKHQTTDINDVQQLPVEGERNSPTKRASSSQANQKESTTKRTEPSRNGFYEEHQRPHSKQQGTITESPSSHTTTKHFQEIGQTHEAKHRDNDESNNAKLTDSGDRKAFIERMNANNPSHIKKMFASLHENEWMDAHGVLEQKYRELSEKKITEKLLDIVKDVYEFCERQVQKQLAEIEQKMKYVVLFQEEKTPRSSRGDKQQNVVGDVDIIRQYCSLHADKSRDHLMSKYTTEKRERHTSLPLQERDMAVYVEKCIEVTWLMCLQDPPITLHPTDRFLPSVYNDQPKKGKHHCDYIVWPPLLQDLRLLAPGEVRYKKE